MPYGLASIPDELKNLFSFFNLDPLLVTAAATGVPDVEPQTEQADVAEAWLSSLSQVRACEIVRKLLAEDPNALKRVLLIEARGVRSAVSWPVAAPHRTLQQLIDAADILRKEEKDKQEREAAARAKREAEKAEEVRHAELLK